MTTQFSTDAAVIDSPADTLLSVRGVSKVYPGTRALDDVDLEIRSGEIHALVGGNGCGKSTLIKILSGVVEADGGTVRIADTDLDAASIQPEVIHDLGIRVVHQDLAVFPGLSVAENLRLGAEYPVSRLRNVRWKELRQDALEAIERFEMPARPEDLVGDLPVAARAQVAIARALRGMGGQRGVIILDEATASLPAREVEILFAAVRRLAAAGHAVLFVSHRLDEVLGLSQRVTVMRDGQVIAEHSTAALTEKELIASILGDRAAESTHDGLSDGPKPVAATPREREPKRDVLLSVAGLSAGPLQDVEFEIRAGEVVGVAGLLGSGRTELLLALYGDLRKSAGKVVLNGREVDFRNAADAIDAGVVLIPEDRANGGVFSDLSVDENLTVGVLPHFWAGGWFRRQKIQDSADALRKKFRVKTASGRTPIKALSGGNQQKVVLARWLRRNPALLLLDEPSQGVDVGARADIYAAVREATDAGSAAIVVTSDLEELAQVVDRALVLYEGRLVGEVPAHHLNAQHLNEAIYKNEKSDD